MKLTNQDLYILRELLEDKIDQIDRGPDNEVDKQMPIHLNLLKKLDSLYFQ
jgi:hypothetical protein